MKVVLLSDVPGLGQLGQVKEVAGGYGRNYLLPRKLAEMATTAALAKAEQLKAKEARLKAKAETDMRELGELLEGLNITLRAKAGAEGKLFGSVSAADIAEELSKQAGHEIDKRRVALEDSIRQVGTHPVTVRLSPEVTPTINVVVEPEE